MIFQDDLAILIADLEEILWDSQLSEDSGVLAFLERVRYYLLTHQSYWKPENYQKRSERLTEDILKRLETQIIPWVQSVENDLENLRDQKQFLLQEIRQLEHKRKQMMSEFSEELTIGCTQVIEGQSSKSQKSDCFGKGSLNNLSVSPEMSSERSAGHIEALGKILDSPGQDLQTYSDCLAQEIERIHNFGEQGEAKFLAYSNRLQQQLEATVGRTTLASSLPKQSARVKSTREKWFLGIDLTSEQLMAVLLGFSAKISPNTAISTLEEKVNLSSVTSSNMMNPLARWKPALKTLKTQLMAQTTSLIVGETEYSVTQIMNKLQGVIIVCPSQWNLVDRTQLQSLISDIYSLSTSDQIIWVPKAIAVALSYLSLAETTTNTLIIDVGETMTELALVNVKNPFSSLISRQLDYGFQSINQDILCQLIYPQWQPQITKIFSSIEPYFPQVGSTDLSLREAFSQKLKNHPLGNVCLEVAQLTRLILKQQDSFVSSLGEKSWGVTRQEFIQQIVTHWIERLNETSNSLFSLGETSQDGIGQIIILGKEIETVDYILSTWLQKKFFHKTVILKSQKQLENQLTQGLVYILNFI
ncbi:hypothetical protein [cyanobacterium endosymbiont of Epithemia clementina EcSB]|uniref:hypothetical protein n=1 Tax=cyanobacterium endosymbiont of Epithemia clementina EcSB TaxID=3034674 RepID=UPI00248006D5|nr:hypothetical protein [cyanobacterium endosymbiont of Epithemia clementina EcSB]WGT68015.1 hypothetical protein P3F56_02735 [cyanobacterium endosymbiont of Epithemia clementina EcSB]